MKEKVNALYNASGSTAPLAIGVSAKDLADSIAQTATSSKGNPSLPSMPEEKGDDAEMEMGDNGAADGTGSNANGGGGPKSPTKNANGLIPREASGFGIEQDFVMQLLKILKCTLIIGDVHGEGPLAVKVVGGAKAKNVLEGKNPLKYAADIDKHSNILLIGPRWDGMKNIGAEIKEKKKQGKTLDIAWLTSLPEVELSLEVLLRFADCFYTEAGEVREGWQSVYVGRSGITVGASDTFQTQAGKSHESYKLFQITCASTRASSSPLNGLDGIIDWSERIFIPGIGAAAKGGTIVWLDIDEDDKECVPGHIDSLRELGWVKSR